ncbi:MAG: M20/M25/M40 family metallo-hydrolase, partial [Candidatus Bathyarchaeota archaeon]
MKTPSVSGSEATVAQLIKKHMDELGYMSSIDTAGNVIGVKGTGKPHVLLCGHIDTVPGNLPVTLDNGIITGRGSVDAKGPFAALIIGGSLAVESGFTGSLIVAGVVDEEGRNKGIKELIKHGYEIDYAVFGEPTDTNTITIGYKGTVLIRAEVRTMPGHSSAPWLYINAIEKGMELFRGLKNDTTKMTEEKEGINALTATIRQIIGGENCGMIPSYCQIWVEFRVPSSISIEKLVETVTQRKSEFCDTNDGVSVDLVVVDLIEPYNADHRNNLVKAFT